MSQHDFDIANQGFPATRADINNAFQAIASNSSGPTAPSTTYANMWWYDTTNDKMYLRNAADSAWIEVAVIDQANGEWKITTGVVQAKDSDGLALKTDDGTTRLFIKDSDGSIGIGTSSPVAPLHVIDKSLLTGTAPQLRLNANADDASDDDRLMLGLATGSGQFVGGSVAGDGILRTTNGGNLIFGEGTTERMRILAGGGLTFNGDTAAANALDDYEEGTFTPTMRGGNTDGTTTYQDSGGKYTKIGNVCHVQIVMWATTSGASGSLLIGNLPFSAISGSEVLGSFQCNNMGLSYQSGVGQYTPVMQSGTDIHFRGTKTDGSNYASMQIQDMTYLRVSITYQTT